jgi:hypothetical protein
MCSPEANLGKPPRTEFVVRLEEAREEWKCRFLNSGYVATEAKKKAAPA